MSTRSQNNQVLYLAIMALGLLLVPFLIQGIQSNAVAQYKSTYASQGEWVR